MSALTSSKKHSTWPLLGATAFKQQPGRWQLPQAEVRCAASVGSPVSPGAVDKADTEANGSSGHRPFVKAAKRHTSVTVAAVAAVSGAKRAGVAADAQLFEQSISHLRQRSQL